MSDQTADTLITRLRKLIWNSLLRVPWLIGYNVAGAFLLAAIFAGTSQGNDLLRISAERGFVLGDLSAVWNLLFLLGTLLVSMTFWYSSRLLLGRDYPSYPLDPQYAAPGRRWWPRLIGIVVPVAIGWTFLGITSRVQSVETVLGWMYLAMAALLLVFYVLRRSIFGVLAEDMIEQRRDDVELRDRQRIRIIMIVSFAMLLLFMVFPVFLPQLLGAPALLVLGIGGICLFGTAILTYMPMKRAMPAATLSALLLALVSGIWNDNHALRVAGNDAPSQAVRGYPADQLQAWIDAQPPTNTGRDQTPLLLVTSSGGGIRAAYWTASTLAYLEDKWGTAFSDRLFALSTVSGGSVGAAVYISLKRAQLDAGETGSMLAPAREVLGHDFLSPITAGMLFPDLAQRFFPIPIGLADRQRFLERSWETAMTDDAASYFRGSFLSLYQSATGARLPSLLLNATAVETGQRAVVSNMRVDHLPLVIDLLQERYQLANIRTSAAAGASARFTYVSPAGTVSIQDGAKLRLVDGGYFENSGAATMADLIELLNPAAYSLKPVLMLIRNDTDAHDLCRRENQNGGEPMGDHFNATVSEVSAPAEALLDTREARGRISEVRAARLVEALGGDVIEVPLSAVLQNAMQAVEDDTAAAEAVRVSFVEPPLGWSLSKQVRVGMDETLETEGGGLAEEFKYLAIALGIEPGSVPDCLTQTEE
jgi:hypothetical protein